VIAGYGTAINNHEHRRWVIDYVDGTARERYLTWLRKVAATYPRAKTLFVIMGIFPAQGAQCGKPFFMPAEFPLTDVVEMASSVFKKDDAGVPFEYDGRPANLWLKIPLSDLPEWAARGLDGPRFEASAEYGAVRVRLAGPDTEREFAYFLVDRGAQNERVAVVYAFQGGQLGHAIEDDVFESIRVFPASSKVILTEVSYNDSWEDTAGPNGWQTSVADLLSMWEATAEESVEAAERLEPDPQPRSDDPLVKRAINEDFNT